MLISFLGRVGSFHWTPLLGVGLGFSLAPSRYEIGHYARRFHPAVFSQQMDRGSVYHLSSRLSTVIDVEAGVCKMPTTERWHCLLTDAEKENSPELHLFDWRPYNKGSCDPYLSLRNTEQNPTV